MSILTWVVTMIMLLSGGRLVLESGGWRGQYTTANSYVEIQCRSATEEDNSCVRKIIV